ncbi:sulfite exporter TauE/SafE family protein [Membranihabitans marinus]|uniref:sulfite exporter TauE/SafE family protein n=1 Tax=Membranihabitans marinus TaxID=1227546 RepID=UPI001F31876E|nr:sulfite exporter TauE/SafE family protein [Membranihabitans marinus]
MVIGFVFALIIGFVLGIIGGGGSILAVPVLVYFIQLDPVLATAYSLFIVGTSSLVGGIKYAMRGGVDFKTTIIFGIPAVISVFFTRYKLIPLLPDHLFNIFSFHITKNFAIMILFGGLMIAAAYSMIRTPSKSKVGNLQDSPYKYFFIWLEGILVGILTGLVGAGGGFLIIPALVILTNIPFKKAIGTSLFIIAAKSLIGFLGDVSHQNIQWSFLIPFTAVAVLGIFLGSNRGKNLPGKVLRKGFGWFTLVTGLLIFMSELYFLSH